jgi:hypothetical protein
MHKKGSEDEAAAPQKRAGDVATDGKEHARQRARALYLDRPPTM